MDTYDPKIIEPKWQKKWEKSGFYEAVDLDKRPKKYLLIEFPYPSGERLHVGHGRSYAALDALARKWRMEGKNVLYPIGWDAFGLPAENYAIKTGINPTITTEANIKNAKKQAKSWGLSFDWSREINTTDPDYYQWTQWIFLKMLEHGLAYQDEVAVNWCPNCKTNLADEEVLADGTHERCGKMTEKRKQKQWLLRITKYADRLLKDLQTVDYLPKIRIQQENWIGRKEGVEIEFSISMSFPRKRESRPLAKNLDPRVKPEDDKTICIFTTAHETIFGATFMVLSPEYPLVVEILNPKSEIRNKFEFSKSQIQNITDYIEKVKNRSELERKVETKEKTGVDTGLKVINPFTHLEMPVYVADYVLMSYGTGAVMGVPGHDARDHEFAQKYKLPVKIVVQPQKTTSFEANILEGGFWDYEEIKTKYATQSEMVNSGFLNGLTSFEAKKKIEEEIVKLKIGKKVVIYHLRDWVFSRQHYWGEPIPVVYCEKDGIVPVPYDQLPVRLPYVEKYEPTGTGESPLAGVKDWVNTKCPKCGGPAKRETDTMPNWAGSNWYYVGYLVAKKLHESHKSHWSDKTDIFSQNKELLKYWLPVDLYNGGMEHTTLHLLYSRFIYKFLFDIGVVPGIEPYQRRHSHGTVLGQDGQKMSKSRGNVINPDEIIKTVGADTFRLYEMFMGPFEQTVSWSEEGMMGCYRFLKRVWQMTQTKTKDFKTPQNLQISLQKTIKKVGEDLEGLKFNTAIASMMEFLNLWAKPGMFLNKKDVMVFLQILSPFAPHMTEELWSLGFARDKQKLSIHASSWPKYNAAAIQDKEVVMIVEVNGKIRDKLETRNCLPAGKAGKPEARAEIEKMARESGKVKKYLVGKKVKKIIFVPGKLINFVVE